MENEKNLLVQQYQKEFCTLTVGTYGIRYLPTNHIQNSQVNKKKSSRTTGTWQRTTRASGTTWLHPKIKLDFRRRSVVKVNLIVSVATNDNVVVVSLEYFFTRVPYYIS